MTNLQRGVLWGCGIELLAAAIIFLLVMLSCGVMPLPPKSMPAAVSAPVPNHIVTKSTLGDLPNEMTVTGKLYVRAAPGGDVISYRLAGDVVPVFGADGQWCKIGCSMWVWCRWLDK